MISCRQARHKMLEVLRQSADEATRLQLEVHLDGCLACQEERARWALLGALREHTPPPLGSAADHRILGKLTASKVATEPAPRSSLRWVWVAVPAAAVAVAAIVALPPLLRSAHDAPAEGARLEAQSEGNLTFADALVRYEPGTALEFHPGRRTLALLKGEVDIDVRPGGRARFRVVAPRFTVEVLGTRFVVTLDGVSTLRGKVRVLDRGERELAVLEAGESWTLPATPVVALGKPQPPAPTHASPAAPAQPAAGIRPVASAQPAPAAVHRANVQSAHDLLGRAKEALAEGDAQSARSLVGRALRVNPAERDVAAASLLLADARLVESRPDEAIGAYREVARRHGNTPEAETALFAAAQLLVERGRPAEAAATFNEYLARYPMGRFVREVRERLEQVRPTH